LHCLGGRIWELSPTQGSSNDDLALVISRSISSLTIENMGFADDQAHGLCQEKGFISCVAVDAGYRFPMPWRQRRADIQLKPSFQSWRSAC
jgi:hypothetical protein